MPTLVHVTYLLPVLIAMSMQESLCCIDEWYATSFCSRLVQVAHYTMTVVPGLFHTFHVIHQHIYSSSSFFTICCSLTN